MRTVGQHVAPNGGCLALVEVEMNKQSWNVLLLVLTAAASKAMVLWARAEFFPGRRDVAFVMYAMTADIAIWGVLYLGVVWMAGKLGRGPLGTSSALPLGPTDLEG